MQDDMKNISRNLYSQECKAKVIRRRSLSIEVEQKPNRKRKISSTSDFEMLFIAPKMLKIGYNIQDNLEISNGHNSKLFLVPPKSK